MIQKVIGWIMLISFFGFALYWLIKVDALLFILIPIGLIAWVFFAIILIQSGYWDETNYRD